MCRNAYISDERYIPEVEMKTNFLELFLYYRLIDSHFRGTQLGPNR